MIAGVAQQVGPTPQTVTVIGDAQRKELFVNHYVWNTATESRIATGEVIIESPETVAAKACSEQQMVTGPGLEKFIEHFSEVHQLAPTDIRQPSASSIAYIANIQHQHGEQADINTLEPLYIRRSYAEESGRSGRPDRQ